MIVSFTGHRPHHLPWKDKLGTGYSISNKRVQAYASLLQENLRPLILNEGAHTFISGGALGVDQIAFWAVAHLKREFPNLHNHLAIPFAKQHTAWKNPEILHWYHKMVQRADSVAYVDTIEGYNRDASVGIGEYSGYKMQIRNEYMVNHSNVVVAVWNGTSGGTGNCVKYAQEQGKRIIQLHPLQF